MNKNLIQRRKIKYYLINSISLIIPRLFFRMKMKHELKKVNNYDYKYLESRVNYYNRINENFQLGEDGVNLNTLLSLQIKKFIDKILKKKIKKRTTYFFDLYNYLSYFPSFLKVRFKFGDITENFSKPTIVKSRPINDNTNSVLMKLNEVRHFYFLKDNTNFHEKKIWLSGEEIQIILKQDSNL